MQELFEYIGIFFVILYTVAPLLVWYQQRIPDRYRLIPVPKEQFFAEADNDLMKGMEAIVKVGFEHTHFARFSQMDTETKIALFENPQKPYTLYMAEISNPNVPTVLFMEASYLFKDDTVLNVNNTPMPSSFPKMPNKATFRLPSTSDVTEIMKVIEHITKIYFPDKQSTALPRGEALAKIASLLNRELAELVKRAYLKDAAQEGFLKPTLKGAYSMTWKLLWPLRQIVNYREHRFTQKMLKESGFYG